MPILVVARDPFFLVGNKPKPDFTFVELANTKFATVSEVPIPWTCPQEDIRKA